LQRGKEGKLHPKDMERTARGTTGALVLVNYDSVSGKEIKWKFKKNVPGWVDSFNTSPRKELAAYEVQKLFLDLEDYVVPTCLAFCAPRDRFMKRGGYAAATLEGTDCVLGLASIWMVDVTVPDTLYAMAGWDNSWCQRTTSGARYSPSTTVFLLVFGHIISSFSSGM
jgi:hypothetical protein